MGQVGAVKHDGPTVTDLPVTARPWPVDAGLKAQPAPEHPPGAGRLHVPNALLHSASAALSAPACELPAPTLKRATSACEMARHRACATSTTLQEGWPQPSSAACEAVVALILS